MRISVKSKYLKIFILFVVITLPFVMAMGTIISGNIDFGYDHARDFLSAISNINKLTLIGPTSGIPGIFYGPYWIWLISFGLLFSHDPRVVVFIILTLPYFIIFPYVLFKFSKVLGFWACIIIWVLFIFSTGMKYSVSPWNPHPAPLLFLVLIYVITYTNFLREGKGKYLVNILIGFISGAIMNFHISFGIGVGFGTFIYLIISVSRDMVFNKKKIIIKLIDLLLFILAFMLGIATAFLPVLIFEARHGFNQLQVIYKVLSSKAPVVGLTGLSKEHILASFFGTIGNILNTPTIPATGLFVSISIVFAYLIIKKRIKFTDQQIRMLRYLTCVGFGILFLYITSKNPVWPYHFIGVEMVFLFLVGIIAAKIKILKIALVTWISIIILINIPNIFNSFHQNPYINTSSLATEQNVVKSIVDDADRHSFNVFAYSPSIYTYEYSYLFKWINNKDIPYDPGQNHDRSDLVYVIIPPTSKEVKEDFVNYRTPEKMYTTVKQWYLQNGTLIIKRKLKN